MSACAQLHQADFAESWLSFPTGQQPTSHRNRDAWLPCPALPFSERRIQKVLGTGQSRRTLL